MRLLHQILHSQLPSYPDSVSISISITHSLQPASRLEQAREIVRHAFRTAAVLRRPTPVAIVDVVDIDACQACHGHCGAAAGV